MSQLSRRGHIAPHVLVVDGLSGSGKAALSPVLQGFDRVENVLVRYVFDYLCCANHLGRMTNDAADSLIKLLSDIASYDNSISREVNFRPSDVTCALKMHMGPRYQERLLLADGKAALQRIESERPILHLMAHQVFGVSMPIFRALGQRLTFVKVVRHPLSLLTYQINYIERYGTDPADFTVWIDHQGQDLPWFAQGHEDLYLKSRSMDKVIYSLKWLFDLETNIFASLSADQKKRLIVLPFERFVKEPGPYLSRFEGMLGTTRLPVLGDILKAQRIPREVSNAGPDPAGIWRARYGIPDAGKGATDGSEMQKAWALAKKEASTEAFSVLQWLCADYERESPA